MRDYGPLVALVVDDEAAVADEVRACVKQDGRIETVLVATDSQLAIQIISEQPLIDVLFLDIEMPGNNGLEIARLASKMAHPPRVILVSAHDDYYTDARKLGVVDYVRKPFREVRISASIDRFLKDIDEQESWSTRTIRHLQRIGTAQRVAKQERAAKRPREVFISYKKTDYISAQALFLRLTKDNIDCWFDSDMLLPGQNWQNEITNAIRTCTYFLMCLSTASAQGSGYRHAELQEALQVAREQPEGAIYIVPVRLEPCPLPEQLRHLHAVNLYDPDDYDRLLMALQKDAR